MSLPDYWIDRFEVTNRQFKAFVDAGGYRTRDYWKEPIAENGRTLSWDEAMATVPRHDGPAGPVNLGAGHLSGRAGRRSRVGRELVRGRCVRGVCRQVNADGVSVARAPPAGIGGFGGIFSDILAVSNFGDEGTGRSGQPRRASGRMAPSTWPAT